MSASNDGAPSWLFSFVDLAFLMLIAMTQMANDARSQPDFGEMLVPRISSESSSELPAVAAEAWQLRVHPPAAGIEADEMRFELIRTGAEGEPESEGFGEVAPLRNRLTELEAARGPRPLLAPHEDSRSQDLLDAAALIEEFWPGRRRATIARVFGS
jgi:hypothetical protein